ncbi:MAG: endonuclease/exonuclease/phosphatase family protein [Mesorhizobium sp.]|nr:endonuclease/exonuclease/phosphatase family protein [Mesorhizobium sp.]MBL8579033.1 endonuclease/exonuclease/phosphatase family protein [Mesorhizobium sp.]
MGNNRTLRRLGLIAFLAAIPISLALVGGFFGSIHPALDSLAHFRIHLAVALICLSPFLLILPGFRWNGLLAAVLGAWAIISVTGIYFIPGLAPVQASTKAGPEDGPVYRLLQLNLRFNNPSPGDVLSLVGRLRPDVVTLEEVSPMWTEKLALLENAYPFRLFCTLDGYAGGVAIMSLRPFSEGSEGMCVEGGTFGTATVDFGGFMVDVAAMHLHWPWPFGQMKQIADLAPTLANLGDNAILAGDLNATPWSEASAQVAQAAAMKQLGPANPTWIWRRLPEWLRFAGLPIDRIFAKGEIVVHSVRTLEPVGSDHLPVLVEFSPKPPEVEDDPLATSLALVTP